MHTLVMIDIHPNLAWGLGEDEWKLEGALEPYDTVQVEVTPLLS